MKKNGWAVVTGASSGIGRAFARELAGQGYAVLAVARRQHELERLVRAIESEGGTARALVADLSTEDGLDRVATVANDLVVDVLVNNAGIGRYGAFADQSARDDAAQIALDIGAVVGLTRRLLPAMIARRKGRIINVASILAFMPSPFFAVYAATKAFVLHFTEALAHELAGTGVHVLAASPGVVKTEFASVANWEAGLPALSPETVARVALRANTRVVRVMGAFYRFLAVLAAITPRAIMRFIMGTILAPRSKQALRTRTQP